MNKVKLFEEFIKFINESDYSMYKPKDYDIYNDYKLKIAMGLD